MKETILRNYYINYTIYQKTIYTIGKYFHFYISILAARPAFGGPLASQGATPPGLQFDSMPASWMKSAYYNRVDICLCTNTKILSLVQ